MVRSTLYEWYIISLFISLISSVFRGKELPSVPLRELFKRNITQYLKTGRWALLVMVDITS
jgi:hypothetical protein